MTLGKAQLEKLRKVVKLHTDWLVATVLGEDSLTASEREELSKYKKLPVQSLGLVDKSFILGRLKSIFKKSEWKGLSWEDFLELMQRQKLSPLEKLVLQQAKLSAAQHIRGLADDVAAGVFDQLAKATNKTISEASLKELIRDEVKLAVLERKSYKELASNLATRTKTALNKRWLMISRTELHTAKTHGQAQAIINKVDIYKKSKGINSLVSIVPKPGTCPDCEGHYLARGNPKVFPLSQLMGAGSNADSGVSHKKKSGVHLHWKTTLPPLHPNCRCELVFIPPGYSWVSGKLKLTSPSALSKAIGDSALSATAKPQGPASVTPSTPQPASIPGAKSPGQAVQAPKPQSAWAGMDIDYISKEAVKEKPEGALGDTEHSWIVPKGFKSGKPLTPEQEEQKKQAEHKLAVDYGKQDHPHAEVLNHLGSGEFNSIRALSDQEAGASGATSNLVQIAGNGRGLLKDTTRNLFTSELDPVELAGEGTTIPGTGPQREAAAYNVSMMFGLSDHVPPTTTRSHKGSTHSIQSWSEGFSALDTTLKESVDNNAKTPVIATSDAKAAAKNINEIKNLLDKCPEDKKESLKKKLVEGAVLNIIQNNGDSHTGNVLVNDDHSDVRFVDNSAAFGHGMQGMTSAVHRDLHRMGMKVKVPDELMDKFSKTSYGDIKRSTKGLDARESAQTFLRMRYTEHLMNEEGHLDYKKFQPHMTSGFGDSIPRNEYWPGHQNNTEILVSSQKQLADKTDSHSLFEAFARDYISAAQDESHPDNASVASIMADQGTSGIDGILMSPKSFYENQVLPNASGGVHPGRAKNFQKKTVEDGGGTTASKPLPKTYDASSKKVQKSARIYISKPHSPWS